MTKEDLEDRIIESPFFVKWISVKDELPEVNGHKTLLVTVKEGNGVYYRRCARYNEWGFHYPWYNQNSGSVLFGVTHWMELPELPKFDDYEMD